jgi:hypothetical protein
LEWTEHDENCTATIRLSVVLNYPSPMVDEIEEEDQRRLDEVRNARDWPTTAALMHERDLWWKRHRRWDPATESWVAVLALGSDDLALANLDLSGEFSH